MSEQRFYEVIVTRPATESTLIRVRASSIRQANKKALRQARTNGESLKWEVNDCNYNDPDEFYVVDGQYFEEVT